VDNRRRKAHRIHPVFSSLNFSSLLDDTPPLTYTDRRGNPDRRRLRRRPRFDEKKKKKEKDPSVLLQSVFPLKKD
jgi:hypothetical protein